MFVAGHIVVVTTICLASISAYLIPQNLVQPKFYSTLSRAQSKPVGFSRNPINHDVKSSFKLQAKTAVADELAIKPDYSKDIQNTYKWVAAAAVFATGIGFTRGFDQAIEFSSGYLLEQCLSFDNLLVILLIFDYFKIDNQYKGKILSYGIFGAMILRGIFISLGAVAFTNFKPVLAVFGGLLFLTSYKILFAGDDDEDEDISNNGVVLFAKKYLRATEDSDGDKFFVVKEGLRYATPLLVCLVCVELTDVLFAVDSVPAIFGVTKDPFIVFTSNIFAIAGLRALFGLLSQAVEEFIYLEKAVGVVLSIVATKLVAETFGIELLTPLQSLFVTISTLSVGVGAGFVFPPPVAESDEVAEVEN